LFWHVWLFSIKIDFFFVVTRVWTLRSYILYIVNTNWAKLTGTIDFISIIIEMIYWSTQFYTQTVNHFTFNTYLAKIITNFCHQEANDTRADLSISKVLNFLEIEKSRTSSKRLWKLVRVMVNNNIRQNSKMNIRNMCCGTPKYTLKIIY
jgi:hypothetical protein